MIANTQPGGPRFISGVEQLCGRCSDDMPSSRRCRWIDTGLRFRDCDRSWRNSLSRRLASRQNKTRIQLTEICKSRDEANYKDAIGLSSVDSNHFTSSQTSSLRYYVEILAIVPGGNLESPLNAS